jgi:hypothetical protein
MVGRISTSTTTLEQLAKEAMAMNKKVKRKIGFMTGVFKVNKEWSYI